MTSRNRPFPGPAALAGLVLLGAASAAAAQPAVDAEINPFPYDPRRELRELFRKQMPTYWWFEEPEFSSGAFTVVVHVPSNWRGNPTGAMIKLCPDRDQSIWNGLDRFFIRPFYQKRSWSTFECRK